MAQPGSQARSKIDAMMEQASRALVGRDYFTAQKLASEALRRAHGLGDFERMARILMPLQEARRQVRDLAFDSGQVTVVVGELPSGRGMLPGCYLVGPPRVGVDGRALRETAERKQTPTIVVVREPTTQDGLWPIVAVGPVTLRTKVAPPAAVGQPAERTGVRERRLAGGRKITRPRAAAPLLEAHPHAGDGAGIEPQGSPPPEWFLRANEALGDAALAQVDPRLPAAQRVEALLERLEAMPDHEKLHQALQAAARQAMLETAAEMARAGTRKPKRPAALDELDGELTADSARDEQRESPPDEDF